MTMDDIDEDGTPRDDGGWDGTINGKLANGDVFVWKIHTLCFGSNDCDYEGDREGTVTLVR